MAEDKKKTPAAGKDLTSKIATAYRNMPPEQRAKPSPDSNDIQNPELDQAFDKMVEMYKMKRPERENSVVSFPAPATVREPRLPAEEGEEYECPECGHNNPVENQFCGMCGAAREDVVVVPAKNGMQPAEGEAAGPAAESGIKHHHHYYHHHHYKNNPYLLLAVVLLLGVIAWQQWREYQREARSAVSVPAMATPSRPASQTQPSPSSSAPSPATTPTPEPATKPVKKPVNRTSTTRPAKQGEPPGPQAQVRKTAPLPIGPPVAPYQSLTDQRVPTLQPFSNTPARPGSTR